jgi:hypothetical protein
LVEKGKGHYVLNMRVFLYNLTSCVEAFTLSFNHTKYIICTHQSLNRCIIQQAIGFLMKAALKTTNAILILCSHGKPLMPQERIWIIKSSD